VRDLPNYLPLPQPITLVRNSPTNSSEESSHDSWQSPANPGDSIARGGAATVSATSPGSLSLPSSAARTGVKLAGQARCEKASESRSAQSICQADKNTAPEVLRPNLGPESAQPSRLRRRSPWSTGPELGPPSMQPERRRKTPPPQMRYKAQAPIRRQSPQARHSPVPMPPTARPKFPPRT
jgi:hypothetical protein